jgi:hypothetical protein
MAPGGRGRGRGRGRGGKKRDKTDRPTEDEIAEKVKIYFVLFVLCTFVLFYTFW